MAKIPGVNVANLIDLSGAAPDSTDYGTWTDGAVIENNSDIKDALIDLENAIEDLQSVVTTSKTEYFTLIAGDITNRFITLSQTPTTPSEVILDIIGGGPQVHGVDFSVSGTTLTWDLTIGDTDPLEPSGDSPLVIGDILRVIYSY